MSLPFGRVSRVLAKCSFFNRMRSFSDGRVLVVHCLARTRCAVAAARYGLTDNVTLVEMGPNVGQDVIILDG